MSVETSELIARNRTALVDRLASGLHEHWAQSLVYLIFCKPGFSQAWVARAIGKEQRAELPFKYRFDVSVHPQLGSAAKPIPAQMTVATSTAMMPTFHEVVMVRSPRGFDNSSSLRPE